MHDLLIRSTSKSAMAAAEAGGEVDGRGAARGGLGGGIGGMVGMGGKPAFTRQMTPGRFQRSALAASKRRWMEGGISNFEYLMILNTLSGRSFNDLTQYVYIACTQHNYCPLHVLLLMHVHRICVHESMHECG